MTDSLAVMSQKVLAKEESDYIESMLKAVSEDLTIKTYQVIRETTWEQLKEAIDIAVDFNPLYELAGHPLNLRFLDVDKWVAILVEYEDEQP